MKRDFRGSDVSSPSSKAPADGQPRTKRDLTVLTVLGLFIAGVVLVYVFGLEHAIHWVHWFFSQDEVSSYSPFYLFSMFCIFVYLLVLRHRR